MLRYSHIPSSRNSNCLSAKNIVISLPGSINTFFASVEYPLVALLALSAGLKTIHKVQQTNYELAFHLNPNLEEAKVREIKEKIESIITSNKGVISYSKEPEKIRLSYKIKHIGNSYFGYIQFNLSEAQALEELNEQLKLNQDVLRYLIVKLPSDLQKKQSMLKQVKMRERQEKRAQTKTTTPGEPKKDSKELDKKLEEIIEGL